MRNVDRRTVAQAQRERWGGFGRMMGRVRRSLPPEVRKGIEAWEHRFDNCLSNEELARKFQKAPDRGETSKEGSPDE